MIFGVEMFVPEYVRSYDVEWETGTHPVIKTVFDIASVYTRVTFPGRTSDVDVPAKLIVAATMTAAADSAMGSPKRRRRF